MAIDNEPFGECSMKSHRFAVVNKELCVSCGACTNECPMGSIGIWKGCFANIDHETCIGCSKCANVCPAGCINIVKRETYES